LLFGEIAGAGFMRIEVAEILGAAPDQVRG